MAELGLSLVDIALVIGAISVAVVCVGINLFSFSKKERETQFHELWFVSDRYKNAVPNRTEFEA